jgi:threonine/homoserine/homoserine lactone efflux protein
VLGFVRYGLPLALALAGVVLTLLGTGPTEAAGITLIGCGALVWFANAMIRLGASSNRDREAEEEARRYYSRHGRWPDENGDV